MQLKYIVACLAALLSVHLMTAQIVTGEYFIDQKLDYGSGQTFTFTSGEEVMVQQMLDIQDLSEGFHALYVRFKDADGRWSQTRHFPFFVKHRKSLLISKGEFFFDPGTPFGMGTPIPVNATTDPVEYVSTISASASIPAGWHQMYYRFQDTEGNWSQTYRERVCLNVVDGRYEADQTSYCAGEQVSISYTGSTSTQAIYNWDLNGDGSFTDLQTNGEDVSFIAPDNRTQLAVAYRLTSTLCAGFFKQDTFNLQLSPPIRVNVDEVGPASGGQDDGFVNVSVSGGQAPFTFEWLLGNTVVSTAEDPSGLAPGVYTLSITDQNGCTTSTEVEVTVMVSNRDLADLQIQLIPNPSDGNFTINIQSSIREDMSGTILNSLGQSLRHLTLRSNQTRVDLSEYPAGIYYLRIDRDAQSTYKRITLR